MKITLRFLRIAQITGILSAFLLGSMLLGCTPRENKLPEANFPTGWAFYPYGGQNIEDMTFDQEGFLWAVSSGDLVRWNPTDGSYQKFTATEGPPKHITRVLAASDGSLWIGAKGKIVHLKDHRWDTYPLQNEKVSISEIYQDSHDLLWFGVPGIGAITFDGTTWYTHTFGTGPANTNVTAIGEDENGNIWLATPFFNCGCEAQKTYPGGVSRFDGRTWTVLKDEIGLAYDNDTYSSQHVNIIANDHQGGIWLGTRWAGAIHFDGQKTSVFTTTFSSANNTITDILVANDGVTWFATWNGVVKYDGKQWTTYKEQDGLVNNGVFSAALAPDGAVWFGTEYGISRFDGQTWHTYLMPIEPLPTGRLVTTPQGAVWLASRSLVYFDGKKIQKLPPEEDILSIALAPDGRLWFGTKQGIAYLNDQLDAVYLDTQEQQIQSVSSIVFDTVGGIWLSSDHGLWYFDGQTWTNYWFLAQKEGELFIDQQNHLWMYSDSSSRFDGQSWIEQHRYTVTAMALDLTGRMWLAAMATDGRPPTDFKSFNGEKWEYHTSLPIQDVSDMDFAPDGTLWVGTHGQGIYYYKNQAWQHLTDTGGLETKTVHTVHAADDGAIWFGLEDGWARYEP